MTPTPTPIPISPIRRARGWHTEPCPARHPTLDLGCQRPQKWLAQQYPGHRQHVWRGEMAEVRTEVAWHQDVTR